MMRKLLTSVSAVAIAGFAAFGIVKAANLPLFSNIALQEPSQELAALNTLVQAINTGVTGNFAYVPGPVGNTGTGTTTQNITFASAVVPTGTLVAAGQGYRARCAGTSNVATAFKVGITVGRSMAVSQENFPVGGAQPNNSNWDLELQFQAATNPVTANYTWMARAFAAIASGTVSGSTLSVNSGNDTTVTDNNANFQLPITCVMYGGATTGEVTMMNFAIEQLR